MPNNERLTPVQHNALHEISTLMIRGGIAKEYHRRLFIEVLLKEALGDPKASAQCAEALSAETFVAPILADYMPQSVTLPDTIPVIWIAKLNMWTGLPLAKSQLFYARNHTQGDKIIMKPEFTYPNPEATLATVRRGLLIAHDVGLLDDKSYMTDELAWITASCDDDPEQQTELDT